MASKLERSTSVDTGGIQRSLEAARQGEQRAERALARAQEARDTSRQVREQAEQLFRDATRAVLG